MINNVQNLFNITNLTEKIDDILIYLKKESNAYSIIKEIKLFLESYSVMIILQVVMKVYIFIMIHLQIKKLKELILIH